MRLVYFTWHAVGIVIVGLQTQTAKFHASSVAACLLIAGCGMAVVAAMQCPS